MKFYISEMKTKIRKQKTPNFPPTLDISNAQVQGRRSNPIQDYHQHKSKRFWTSKHDDSYSACPSIQKELPQLVIGGKMQQTQSTQMLEDLMNENKLKVEAVVKANEIIQLLHEEISELNSRIEDLQSTLRQKQRIINHLGEQMCNSSQDRILSRQVYTEREREPLQDRQHKSGTQRDRQKTPTQKGKSKQPTQRGVKSRTELFFQFALERQTETNIKKATTKIVNTDHPNFREDPYFLMSQKMAALSSRRTGGNVNQQKQQGLISKIAILTIAEEIQNSRLLMEQIGQLVQSEEEEWEQTVADLKERQNIVLEEDEQTLSLHTLGDLSAISKHLFSTNEQPYTSSDDRHQSSKDILNKYEQIIQQYRDYAAYLKSYLCQAFNALSSSHHQQNLHIQPTIRLVSQQIAQQFKSRLRSLKKQNQELKGIIEGLIQNIELAKQSSVQEWRDGVQ